MQSLKIIIFRDTDKPYTMIISKGILVGIAFSLIALMSLFTFSVMSNVMFYKNGGPDTPVMLAQAGQEDDQGDIEMPDVGMPQEDESDSQLSEQGEQVEEVGEETGGNDDYEDTPEETTDTQTANNDDDVASRPVEETPTETLRQTPDTTINTLSSITPYMPAESEVEAFLIDDAIIGTNSIRVRAQVQKRLNRGERYRGRFCAALVDNDGNIGPTYPNQVNIEGNQVLNPDRANTFRIGYRRNYDIQFNSIDPTNYSAIVFYLFDEESKTLQWRNSVPLTR